MASATWAWAIWAATGTVRTSTTTGTSIAWGRACGMSTCGMRRFNNVHYNSYAVNSRLGPRVSYNGGKGGVRYYAAAGRAGGSAGAADCADAVAGAGPARSRAESAAVLHGQPWPAGDCGGTEAVRGGARDCGAGADGNAAATGAEREPARTDVEPARAAGAAGTTGAARTDGGWPTWRIAGRAPATAGAPTLGDPARAAGTVPTTTGAAGTAHDRRRRADRNRSSLPGLKNRHGRRNRIPNPRCGNRNPRRGNRRCGHSQSGEHSRKLARSRRPGHNRRCSHARRHPRNRVHSTRRSIPNRKRLAWVGIGRAAGCGPYRPRQTGRGRVSRISIRERENREGPMRRSILTTILTAGALGLGMGSRPARAQTATSQPQAATTAQSPPPTSTPATVAATPAAAGTRTTSAAAARQARMRARRARQAYGTAESRPEAGRCIPLDRAPRSRGRNNGAGSVVCATAAGASGEADERATTGAACIHQGAAADAGGAAHPGLAGRPTPAVCTGDSSARGAAGRRGHPGSSGTGADNAQAGDATGFRFAAASSVFAAKPSSVAASAGSGAAAEPAQDNAAVGARSRQGVVCGDFSSKEKANKMVLVRRCPTLLPNPTGSAFCIST